jgi:hypothetical protein
VSGSSNSTADTSLRTSPRPSEIFCLASAARPAARWLSWPLMSSISAISPTRFLICASGTLRLRSGNARFSATVMVS